MPTQLTITIPACALPGLDLRMPLDGIGAITGPLVVGYLVASKVSFTIIFSIFFAACLITALNVLILGKETRVRESVKEEETTFSHDP